MPEVFRAGALAPAQVAAGTVRDSIGGLFDGLVPAEVIAAYDRLLARDGCAKDQAEALVGDVALVDALTGWGMAYIQPHSPSDPAWLRPASPDLALQGVLAGHQNRLAGTRSCCWMGTGGSPTLRRSSASA